MDVRKFELLINKDIMMNNINKPDMAS
ncbi:uncharacterized protein METZ01_LOCUS483499 [marine metagenome]|uniref:Uncharacterized protein n=1 Tax=marine metagenome TaxID=408172 RepID=A0A383CFZ9_9ZZZZ